MACSSKSLVHDEASIGIEDLKHLYASNANVSNFVSVKLSGNNNYHLWKKQMICRMETHSMCSLVDDSSVDGPINATDKRYDSLLKGWIFGSISEGALGTVVDLDSAKKVWNELERIYVPSKNCQQDSAQVKPEEKEETKNNDASTETKTKGNDAGSQRDDQKKELCRATMQGCWEEVQDILKKGTDLERQPLNGQQNTVLHLAVGIGHDDFIRSLLQFIIKKEEPPEKNSDSSGSISKVQNSNGSALTMQNSNGSTALHVAAIVGNKYAAELLVNKNKNLLKILDNENQPPLLKAYSNMQFDTFIFLWNVANEDGKPKQAISEDRALIDIVANEDGKTKQAISEDRAPIDIVANEDGKTKQAISEDRALIDIGNQYYTQDQYHTRSGVFLWVV